jgi:hypothetical protein
MSKVIELSTGAKVEMREPKVKDMLMVDNEVSQAKKEVMLIANLCTITPSEVGDLSLKDYALLQGAMSGFLS